MKKNRPIVLIGFLTKEIKEAIPTITKEFISGLSHKYRFIPLYADRKYGNTKRGNFNFFNIYYFINHFFQWFFKLILYKPDIVHYPITSYWNLEKSLIFITIGGLFGAKKIGHLHGGAFNEFWNNISNIRSTIAKKCLNSLDCLIVLGKYWESVMKYKSDINISRLSNPIASRFEREIKNTEVRIRNNNKILFVGRVDKKKGVYDIVECARRIKDKAQFTVDIVGPEAKWGEMFRINKLIIRYDLKQRISLKGPLYGQDKIKIFNKSAIFLFPSYSENFPLVIIEAAAAGLAIITTPVGSIPEFFEHNKSVIFIEPGNVDQISSAVIELIKNDKRREMLGRSAREVFFKKLSRKKILESLDNIYQSVLNKDI